MNIEITLTDNMKRAMRFLGYSKADIKTEIERQCSDLFENLVKRAKREWVENRGAEEIFPEPLEE